jgi:hypothetical protein
MIEMIKSNDRIMKNSQQPLPLASFPLSKLLPKIKKERKYFFAVRSFI